MYGCREKGWAYVPFNSEMKLNGVLHMYELIVRWKRTGVGVAQRPKLRNGCESSEAIKTNTATRWCVRPSISEAGMQCQSGVLQFTSWAKPYLRVGNRRKISQNDRLGICLFSVSCVKVPLQERLLMRNIYWSSSCDFTFTLSFRYCCNQKPWRRHQCYIPAPQLCLPIQ